MLNIILVVFALVNAYLTDDEVKYLPGFNGNISFKHYSGYLRGSNTRKLHYWFVESERNSSNDPLVVWMNGGPGCSSLDGLLSELGPFHIRNKGEEVYLNEYSWNKVANVIFLEAPAGVGFSYDDNNDYSFTDDQVSLDNYLALKDFFVKYPQFLNNSLYITGESYGGIYVPTLTKRIAEDLAENRINLKGYAIGNGLLSVMLNDQSIVYFAYHHGLFGEKLWKELNEHCCSQTNVCNFNTPQTEQCKQNVRDVLAIIFDIGLNEYSLYRPCEKDPNFVQFYTYIINAFSSFQVEVFKKLFSASFTLNASSTHDINHNEVATSFKLKEEVPCLDSSAITNWLNKQEVRKALHIPNQVGHWDVCSATVNQNYQRLYDDMYKQIDYLMDKGIRGLVYNGDTDMVCNFLGAQWFISLLNITQNGKRAPWYYDGQVGGFVDYYDKLTFATVKGAGHMVPQWRPAPALHMITKFLGTEPF